MHVSDSRVRKEGELAVFSFFFWHTPSFGADFHPFCPKGAVTLEQRPARLDFGPIGLPIVPHSICVQI